MCTVFVRFVCFSQLYSIASHRCQKHSLERVRQNDCHTKNKPNPLPSRVHTRFIFTDFCFRRRISIDITNVYKIYTVNNLISWPLWHLECIYFYSIRCCGVLRFCLYSDAYFMWTALALADVRYTEPTHLTSASNIKRKEYSEKQ